MQPVTLQKPILQLEKKDSLRIRWTGVFEYRR